MKKKEEINSKLEENIEYIFGVSEMTLKDVVDFFSKGYRIETRMFYNRKQGTVGDVAGRFDFIKKEILINNNPWFEPDKRNTIIHELYHGITYAQFDELLLPEKQIEELSRELTKKLYLISNNPPKKNSLEAQTKKRITFKDIPELELKDVINLFYDGYKLEHAPITGSSLEEDIDPFLCNFDIKEIVINSDPQWNIDKEKVILGAFYCVNCFRKRINAPAKEISKAVEKHHDKLYSPRTEFEK